ncbi:enoyl-CoA hydratase/isomerase family protein [Rhodococcus sp. NPDC059968]|uniref:enoyl-CoA hydratase/isomerase family protein n=1 Tax=Rhodococcus sp. NPDC059968 TaxID=3347017 RepID=UPI00366FC623
MSHVHSQPRLLHEQDDGLLVVQLNHSHHLNALDDILLAELGELWTEVRTNSEIRAVLLIGTGTEAFCVGMDHEPDADYQNRTATVCVDLGVPLVVAVNGLVRQEGFHMLSSAAAVVCATHVRFVDPPPGSPFSDVPDTVAALAAGLITAVVPLWHLRATAESMARSLATGNRLCSGVAL